MTYMTIPSTISGGPSIFRSASVRARCFRREMRRTFSSRYISIATRIIYIFFATAGYCSTIPTTLHPDPARKNFVHVGVPITGLTIEALGGSAKDKGKNIFVLGLLARIFQLDTESFKS